MKKIDIVLPAYNEEKGIETFDTALRDVLAGLEGDYTFSVIYVVDKCADNTYGVIKGICDRYKNTTGVQLSRRFGHQNSLVAGLSMCKGDAVIMMDCDMEHPPGLIPEMLAAFERGFEIVYTEREYNESVSFFKRASSRLFYSLINFISDVDIKQSQADFRLISAKVLKAFNEGMNEQAPFLRGLFPWMGFSSTSIKFTSGSRAAGSSQYSFMRMLRFGLNGIVSFSTKPLLLSIYIGCTMALITILYLIYTAIGYLAGSAVPPGWLSTVMFIGLIGSVQLIAVGILGLYVGKAFQEMKARPVFIVENIAGEYSGGDGE